MERLLKAHADYFDVERDYRFAGESFAGYAYFHAENSQYVLVKRAKLWQADTDEHIFFHMTAHLTQEGFQHLLDFMTTRALEKVELTPNHMTTYLTLVVVADEVDAPVAKQVKRTHFRKNFKFGLNGWSDLRIAVADLNDRCILTNSQGKPLKEILQANAFIDA